MKRHIGVSTLREYRIASWRVAVAGGVAAGLVAIAATGVPASAQAAASGGVLHVYESGSAATGLGQDVFTGAFTDYGVDHAGVADNGEINKIVLSNGSFEVNVAKLDTALTPTSNDQQTCTLVLKGTAPTTLLDGTRSYAGITGSITVTEQVALIFPKLKSGKCNETQTAKPIAGPYWVTGSGTVSFS
jgi:hypothetical protein